MRIYDHLIRVFQFGFAGDLRVGSLGVFGSVQSRAEMFARFDAHKDISNATPLEPPFYPMTLSNVAVSLVFWPADDDRTLSAENMEDLCAQSLSVWVGGVDVGVRMATRFVCMTGRVIETPGEAAVTLRPGGPFGVQLSLGPLLVEHLNGYVRETTGRDRARWVPGDPKMTRVVRLSCDVDAT